MGVSGDMKSPPLVRGAKARRRGWGGCALGDNYEGGEAIHQANSVDDRESIRKPVRGHRIHPITNFADGYASMAARAVSATPTAHPRWPQKERAVVGRA